MLTENSRSRDVVTPKHQSPSLLSQYGKDWNLSSINPARCYKPVDGTADMTKRELVVMSSDNRGDLSGNLSVNALAVGKSIKNGYSVLGRKGHEPTEKTLFNFSVKTRCIDRVDHISGGGGVSKTGWGKVSDFG
mmetsp:Transcript_33800/g.61031  ORF Transcript_33800/g.61031 Transcript_33800/m.61031 type:complete len:134 (-) Transcript_33800:857-1258(-)